MFNNFTINVIKLNGIALDVKAAVPVRKINWTFLYAIQLKPEIFELRQSFNKVAISSIITIIYRINCQKTEAAIITHTHYKCANKVCDNDNDQTSYIHRHFQHQTKRSIGR